MNKHLLALELDKVLERLAEHTCCAESREAALALRPVHSLYEAQALMNQTQDAHMLLARFGGPSFGGLKNVNNALHRADAGSVLSMRELLDIAETLRVIRSLTQWRSANAGVESCLDVLFGALTPNKYLEDAIITSIVSEDEMADNASPELASIRRKIRAQESKVREQLDKMTRSKHYRDALQEAIVTMRNGRFVLPVKSEHRNEVPGLVHDTSSSGATVFVEPMAVVEANNEIKVLLSKERDEIDRILSALSAEAGSFAESIKNSFECAVEINLIFAKAQLAYSMNAAVPKLNENGIIELHNARHPLLKKEKAVPVDIRLGRDFDTLVITGPNTGGKTVSIKTVGLLSAMASCGLLIPARETSEISVFGQILADIGDEQSIEQSLSTFSAHMTNIIDILARVDEHSLVLIDELGAGTDPVEGAALAMAILESLAQKGAKIAATTHYAELKAYALQTNRVENACCEFDVATLRPTYRLLIGMPGRSNAFAISERLGMEKAIVDRAAELVSAENTQFEDVIETLEDSRRKLEEERNEAYEQTLQAQKIRREAEEKQEKVEAQRRRELDEAKAQAARIVDQAKREAYGLMAELDKLKKEKEKAKDLAELARRARATVKKGMEAMDAAADPIESFDDDEDYVLPRALVVGDTVLIKTLGKQAAVLSVPDKNGNVSVMAGSAKMRVKADDLRLMSEKTKEKASQPRRQGDRLSEKAAMSADTRLDLRGMTVDDALLEIDRFIDYGLRTGLSEFTIIHGKGTGALRTATQNYLRKSTYVKSFRLGTFGEGENGVTIVVLK
ncbi:MAG TPA: endonuclease MutS2 [Ruminococcaceae bacterium]|nr:endonuclease MutS2 [Oscillospiraceae bacterium]